VFGILNTNLKEKPMGHKLIFTRKRNAKGEIVRYKVRLVAQGFSQKPGVDYEFTYALVMNSTTFRYILASEVKIHINMILISY